ncbi:MAG: serine protease [Planctomycetota bacterium]|nr:serine protease [Planctomycetota bacterium]
MRGTAIIIVLSLLGPCCAPSLLSGQVGQETALWHWTVAADHHEAVVKVSLDTGSGTGIIIHVDRDRPISKGFEGYCLTAYHVVQPDKGRRSIDVEYRNGRVSQKCKLLTFDKALDIAVIWVWVPEQIEAAPLASRMVRVGDLLEFTGLGGGSRLSCCLRHFSATAAAPTNAETIFADVALLPGDSGGPVFNSRQQLVGIISGGWFWWDGGVTSNGGSAIKATWPARACNVGAIQRLVSKIQRIGIASR